MVRYLDSNDLSPGERPPAQRHHSDVLPSGVQERLHGPGHVPETGKEEGEGLRAVTDVYVGPDAS